MLLLSATLIELSLKGIVRCTQNSLESCISSEQPWQAEMA